MILNNECLRLLYLLKQNHPHTYLHSINVANYSVLLGQKLGLDNESIEKLKIIGLFHDIGKLNIPNTILKKPSKLTDEEYEVIKNHPIYSVELLKRAGFTDEEVLRSIKAHHERIDGTGYPEGLNGSIIPFLAKITAISDSFEAMTSNRCYRSMQDLDYAREELIKGAGKQFDLKLVNVFIDLIDKGISKEKVSESEEKEL